MQRHIAFVGRDGAGHINPTLPVVAELVRRGHRVTYAAGDAYGDAVEQAGARHLPLPANDFGGGRAGQQSLTGADLDPAAMIARMLLARTEREFPVLRDGLAADRPDAICYDASSLSGAMVADLLDVKTVQLRPTFAANEHYNPLQEFIPDPGRRAAGIAAADKQVQAFAEPLGVSGKPATVLNSGAADLTVVFLPRRFQYAGETFDERYVFVGPTAYTRTAADPWKAPVAGTRLLFIALGTMMNEHPEFFRLCIRTFGGTAWRVAMAIGNRVNRDDLGPLPANFDVRPYFPQLEVLRHATAFVTHAGMNSTMEALLNGVPTVCVPQMPEQAANARRIQELALGVHLTEITSAALLDAVTEVEDSEPIHKNLAAMRDLLHAAGGALTAADAIEKLISGASVASLR
ncbi:macrolide family glycosyltransferase [Actinoplanes sp. RD1]|uniref:macrolide family glycosyltransferase n=1 Tax=Actinoplanes sp. RD1 TaxID=3064538 RepID=UPI0027418B0D|nr:macrolide family glycosyltransferase [Actinoplanes sp. RD1]